MPRLVQMELPADLETPISAALKLGVPQNKNSFLFESVEDGEKRGRYSVIGLSPDVIWQKNENGVTINKNGEIKKDAQAPLDSLRQLIEETRFELPEGLPSIAAGLFGYMGYDMVCEMETLPPPNPDGLGLPDSIYLRPQQLVLFDSVKDEMILIAVNFDDTKNMAQLQSELDEMKATLSSPLTYPSTPAEPLDVKINSNTRKEDFFEAVQKTIDYIFAGDIYQAVISQRFQTPMPYPPFSFYRALRTVNPSPYLYFMNFGDFVIAGSSPEILVRLKGDKITLRPIAGTTLRPNKQSNQTEKAASEALLNDPKERAEHLMLLDLGRNDVGRVAQVGSVKVKEQFALQWTSHLIHIVSNVEGTLAPNFDGLDAMLAGFPAGTVSGAPKIRAMEIIAELEKEKRGTYAGALGYFSANGDVDSCITLRTGIIKDETLYIQTGGGIVADSTPEYEYQESINKAAALHRAAERTHEFVPAQQAKKDGA